ncbi:MAG: NERD domain-containing protein [Anaerolineales bacterium]
MKALDFTPLRKPDGSFDPMDRIKATLQFGPSWFAILEGQDHVVALLGRNLDNSYTLLRNFTLPGTELMFPLILVGPTGVFVLSVLNERGLYRAKGEEWSIIQGERVITARVNPLKRTLQYVAVLQKYLAKQGFEQVKVEGVLLAASPGLQVESVRPAARVVMFDALDRFAISVAQTPPALAPAFVQQVVERIQRPASDKKTAAAPASPPGEEAPVYVPESRRTFYDEPQQASNSLTSPSDDRLAFGFVDDQPAVREESPRRPAAESAPKKLARRAAPRKKKGGLSNRQLAILGGVFLFWVCLLVVFIVWAVINAV